MFQYRERLHGIMESDRWQQALIRDYLYNNKLTVFFGDSQIELWAMAESFGSFPTINKGISGDYAFKAIDRFEKDVIDLKPKLLVILIGINDLRVSQNIDTIVDNIEIMLKKSKNDNINIILCSLLPVRNEHIKNHSLNDILRINSKLKILSQQYETDYADFHSQLVDKEGQFKRDLTTDGLHPNKSGYLKMSKVLFPYLIK